MNHFKHPPLAPGQIDAAHRMAKLGGLALESGDTIRDFHQSYVTHGELNGDKSNAVLVCISLTGNHHRLDFLIGQGKALDSSRYFIIAADPIGNGLSTSPSNSTVQPGMRFPRFGIRDMVNAQYQLLSEHLGVDQLHAVIGASMGGMQALQWAVSHSKFMKYCVAMTPMARTHPWAALVTEAARSCLMADPAWNGNGFNGIPERGWRAYTGLMTALLWRTPAPWELLADMVPPIAGSTSWWRAIAQTDLTPTITSTSPGPTRRTTSGQRRGWVATRLRRWRASRRRRCCLRHRWICSIPPNPHGPPHPNARRTVCGNTIPARASSRHQHQVRRRRLSEPRHRRVSGELESTPFTTDTLGLRGVPF